MGKIMSADYLRDTIRNVGYTDIYAAAAEIIDNSIEAEGKEVIIFGKEIRNSRNNKNELREIAFLDNGKGMDYTTLKEALTLGASTRRKERKSMGRFGVGLTQSSMAITTRVEVYSWQNGIKNCKMVYLDVNKIKEGDEFSVKDPVDAEIPIEYEKFIPDRIYSCCDGDKINFLESGTLVVWKNCDRHLPKQTSTFFNNLEYNIGRKYRHYLHNKKHRIIKVDLNNIDGMSMIKPVDPLFLYEDNLYLGNLNDKLNYDFNDSSYNIPFFEPYNENGFANGEYDLIIKYYDENYEIKEGKVKIRASMIKEEFYSLDNITVDPGGKPFGKIAKKCEGISIIRANRELTNGEFDFYSNENDPVHRWWGMEIMFSPDLDEVFAVNNSKQGITLKKEDLGSDDDEVQPIWIQLSKIIIPTIKNIKKRNKALRQTAISTQYSTGNTMDFVDEVESDSRSINNKYTIKEKEKLQEKIGIEKANLMQTEKIKEIIAVDKEKANELTENPQHIYKYINTNVIIINIDDNYTGYIPSSNLFKIKFELGKCICYINRESYFYKTHIEVLDDKGKQSFELFLSALAITLDNVQYTEEMDTCFDLIDKWNEKINKFFKKKEDLK